ncbi:metallophosphoesterase [Jeotgalibacillus soli]|uniref:Phosphoesterase n=1 Tax=Jeotgalibacillus soli TaxID=889306 RepID=A0A0C2VKW0_9BACL|nr:metallophosphoesterase [Jeotgalibacillus soli]KIL44618.1 hypothetical protein KP78_35820 [Jeotgalibacillus soli]
MKILVISDNHSDRSRIMNVKKHYEGKVDAMFHCGDSELPYDSVEMKDFIKVRGNCDGDHTYLTEHIEKMDDDTTVFITHGHLYGIKESLQRIHYKAKEVEANLIFFGHSHQLGAEVIDGCLYVNPGSILLPRDRNESSYAIVEKNGQDVSVVFLKEDHEEITSWSGKL